MRRRLSEQPRVVAAQLLVALALVGTGFAIARNRERRRSASLRRRARALRGALIRTQNALARQRAGAPAGPVGQ